MREDPVMKDFVTSLAENFKERFESSPTLSGNILLFLRQPFSISADGQWTAEAKRLLPSIDEAALQMEVLGMGTMFPSMIGHLLSMLNNDDMTVRELARKSLFLHLQRGKIPIASQNEPQFLGFKLKQNGKLDIKAAGFGLCSDWLDLKGSRLKRDMEEKAMFQLTAVSSLRVHIISLTLHCSSRSYADRSAGRAAEESAYDREEQWSVNGEMIWTRMFTRIRWDWEPGTGSRRTEIQKDEAEIVVGDRQDRETGTGDRRTRIQRDEAGIVVGDRQDRETGTGDRRTRIQRDEAGIVVGDRQDRETGTGDRQTRIQRDEARDRSRGQAGSGNRDSRQANRDPEGRGGDRSRGQAGSGNRDRRQANGDPEERGGDRSWGQETCERGSRRTRRGS
ncbi:hypothetical protein N1851_014667 [Merluccius polli]|uniref:Uncharacterized protein n=1 Tax=Merluccius polli TaxID=89951 RepID=A0AA47P372_MERPO|nr:hypothetical protein N1851_014667 [Merluccius polli]